MRKRKPDKWDLLRDYIREFVDASVAESWKGGGDPMNVPVIEAQLEYARARLAYHIHTLENGE